MRIIFSYANNSTCVPKFIRLDINYNAILPCIYRRGRLRSVSVCASLKIISLKLISKLKDTYTSLTHTKAHHGVDLAIAAVHRRHRCDRYAARITETPNSCSTPHQLLTLLSRILLNWTRWTSNSINSINWWYTIISDDVLRFSHRCCSMQLLSRRLVTCSISSRSNKIRNTLTRWHIRHRHRMSSIRTRW